MGLPGLAHYSLNAHCVTYHLKAGRLALYSGTNSDLKDYLLFSDFYGVLVSSTTEYQTVLFTIQPKMAESVFTTTFCFVSLVALMKVKINDIHSQFIPHTH